MAWTVLLLSDQAGDVRDVLRAFPIAPYRLVTLPLKGTAPQDLIEIHPEVLLIDGTGDIDAAEDATRSLSMAWEIGLPPIIVVVDED
jgi:hypothetical protein